MTAAARPRPVAIDTDPGIDDALALMLALRSPELRVELITTVAGNVAVQMATANARRMLALLAPPAWPVVAQGAARPLRRPLYNATAFHGDDGLGGMLVLLYQLLDERHDFLYRLHERSNVCRRHHDAKHQQRQPQTLT